MIVNNGNITFFLQQNQWILQIGEANNVNSDNCSSESADNALVYHSIGKKVYKKLCFIYLRFYTIIVLYVKNKIFINV